jgi:NTP pyrophosphatase (non-canonical NTP hydrolase)
MNEEQVSVLEQAIQKYGIGQQLDMAVEECAELIQAINKVKRAGIVAYHITKPNQGMDMKTVLKYTNLCGEVADVKIMIAQLELMLDAEYIKISVDRKIERLKKRLNEKR